MLGLIGLVFLLNRVGLYWNYSMIVFYFFEIKIKIRNYDVFVEIVLKYLWIIVCCLVVFNRIYLIKYSFFNNNKI